jgi:excisionase family DNA binding protein
MSTAILPVTSSTDNSTSHAAYTVAQIAALAQASERHIWRLVDQGKVPGRIKGLGRLVRFSKSAVDAWLSGH